MDLRIPFNEMTWYMPLYLGLQLLYEHCDFWSRTDAELGKRFYNTYIFNAL